MGTGGRVNLTEDDQGGGVVRQMLAIDDEGKGGLKKTNLADVM